MGGESPPTRARFSHPAKLVYAHEVVAAPQMAGQRRHTTSSIEILYGRNDCCLLCSCAGMLRCFLEDILWNINRCFHASILA